MSSEVARVEIKVHGDDDIFWNAVYVNGFEMPCRQRARTIEQAHELEYDLKRIVEDAFRLGYRQGYSSCQRLMKDVLGVK